MARRNSPISHFDLTDSDCALLLSGAAQVARTASAMSDSDDDVPLAQRAHKPSVHDSDEEDDQPLANRQVTHKPTPNGTVPQSNGVKMTAPAAPVVATAERAAANGYDSSSSDDDIPLW